MRQPKHGPSHLSQGHFAVITPSTIFSSKPSRPFSYITSFYPTMTSKTTSPDLARRSRLPIPTRYGSPPPQTPPPCSSRLLSPQPPPSPPRSPPSTDALPSPSRKTVRWESPEADGRPKDDRPRMSRSDSTDSIRENERFSPIPWIISPPGSPPPLSLYTSVALLHYHIHHTPTTTCEQTCVPAETSPLPEPNSPSGSPSRSTSASTSPANSIRRTSKVLAQERAMEEFIAVERAIAQSPYILPQDIIPSPKPIKSVDTVVLENSVGKTDEESKDDTEVRESEPDSLVEILQGYTDQDEISIRSIQSSPVIEHARPVSADVDTHSVISSQIVIDVTPQPKPVSPPPTESAKPDEPIEETKPEAIEPLPAPASDTTTITRMPSIQRRGQEYLMQFLAKRKSRMPSLQKPSSQPTLTTATTTSSSPVLIVLSICVILSLLGNLFLMAKLWEVQTPQTQIDRLDYVMKPGIAGETFEIFTNPTTTSWWRRSLNSHSRDALPASPKQEHKIEKQWKTEILYPRLSFGDRGKREIVRALERRIVDMLGWTKVFVGDVLAKVLRL